MHMQRWLSDHGLSLSFAALFVVCLVGQSISGHVNYNSELAMHGQPAIGYANYLATGNFLDGVFTNWQAALLQLGCLIVFAVKFREKGAAHSLSTATQARKPRREEDKSSPWIYRHSLSLAFAALFGLSFIAHLFFGAMDRNARLQWLHRPPMSVGSYSLSSAFWFTTTQTWEAEFSAIAIYVVLSIFLRQQGSPESKPVESSNEVTGETNH